MKVCLHLLLFALLSLPLAATTRTNLATQTVSSQKSVSLKRTRAIPQGATNGSGTVIRILDDDLDGICHQRFIIRQADGSTLLMAHNIDLAPRVPVKRGDIIAFCGEYEWNEKGGVIHWTHRCPRNRHFHGWIRHKNKYYE